MQTCGTCVHRTLFGICTVFLQMVDDDYSCAEYTNKGEEKIMECKTCGTKNTYDSKFCIECGTSLVIY